MGRACCYIIVLYKQKRGNIFVDVSSLLCYNDNNHETKITPTERGTLQKCFLSTLFFKKGFNKNMITQDITKINSTFKKISFNDVLPLVETNLTTSDSRLGIIRKTATTIERSVI